MQYTTMKSLAFTVGGLLLAAVGFLQVYPLLWFKVDSVGDLWTMRFFNLFTGVQFLISFFLVWNGCSFSRHPAFALRNVVTYLSVFVFIFGCLEAWGEYVVLIRWNVDSKLITKNRIAITRYNLYLYRKDCGSFPSQEQGLDAMMKNPGIVGWKGPYLDDDDIVDSWRNLLRFNINDKGVVVVWSIGPDGVDGTVDDIRSNEFLDD